MEDSELFVCSFEGLFNPNIKWEPFDPEYDSQSSDSSMKEDESFPQMNKEATPKINQMERNVHGCSENNSSMSSQEECNIEDLMQNTKVSQTSPNNMANQNKNNQTQNGDSEFMKTEYHSSPSQAANQVVSSTGNDKRKKSTEDIVQKRRCQICNDCASGFHYGVWSCEGCKAFFKRSLQGPVDYVCPSTNTCTIDKQRRKSCQACRLRKCIENGMSRGNCRKERKPSKSKAPKRKLDNEQNSPKVERSGTVNNESTKKKSQAKEELLKLNEMSAASFSLELQNSALNASVSNMYLSSASSSTKSCLSVSSLSSSSTSSPSGDEQQISASSSQPSIHSLVEQLIRIDPACRSSGHDNSKPDTEQNLMTSLMRLADVELVDVINWAKSIPGYTDLELKDRIHLLEVCWMEILLVGVLWNSYNYIPTADALYFGKDLVLDRERLDAVHLTSLGSKLLACLKEFKRLNLNLEEFVLLRTLVLFNADICEIVDRNKINDFYNRAIDALQYTVLERYSGSFQKISHMLTLMPHIRQLSIQWIRHLVTCSTSQQLPMFVLLKEMVDAHINSNDVTYYQSQQTMSNLNNEQNLCNGSTFDFLN